MTQNGVVTEPIASDYQAFAASQQARLQAEARMFASALDLRAPPDTALLKAMQTERRREIFCLRTLLHSCRDATQRARALTQGLRQRPPC